MCKIPCRAPSGARQLALRKLEPVVVGGIIVARAVRPSFSTKICTEPVERVTELVATQCIYALIRHHPIGGSPLAGQTAARFG